MPRAPWHVSSGTPIPNRQACHIGLHSARYMTAAQIADEIGCGLTAGHIEQFWSEIGFEYRALPRGYKLIDVPLAAKHRTKLGAEARRRGIDLPDLASRIFAAVVRDNLFGAILEG